MRVSGVNFAYNKNNKPMCTAQPKRLPISLRPITLTEDRFQSPPYFGAISTHGEFRQLTLNHVIHCPYCRKPMFYNGLLNDMLKSGVFSGEVKNFVTAIEPYIKYLKKGHKTVFQRIKRYAERSPHTHLSEIITDMYQNSIKRLVKVQAGIFKELVTESEKLPEANQSGFRKFMKIQHKRLYEIPYVEDFNNEKFAYKIGKMASTIPDENIRNYLRKISKPLEDRIFNNNTSEIPQEIVNIIAGDKNKHLHTAEDYLRYVIKQAKRIGERIDRQDIIRLCNTSERMLDGKSVVIAFSNKEFIRTLILQELKDIKGTPLYYRMIDIANKLPNSQSSMNSFVVKHRYSDSDTIGYKLIEPSITTLEHIKEQAHGGIHDLTNCALACKADNNERGSIPQYVYLKKWNPHNPQRYFYDLIDIANEEHLIAPSDIEGMAQSFLEQGRVKIDLSKLKK